MSNPLRLGIGGPVGSGKTALMDWLCKRMRGRYEIAAITNDIYTREDAEFLTRSGALPPERIRGVETGFFNPSVSYVISEQWNASFSMPTTRRWFDTINGVTQRNLTWEPTGVVEYVIPAGRGGRSANAGQSRHRLCRWGREKLVEPINSRLYPMASRSRLQDGVAILDQRVGLWIAKAGAYFGDRCVSC
jgi:hypothetical protein